MAERVDVCIVGLAASAARSPPGGWPSSTRRPASTRSASSCSSAAAATAHRLQAVDGRSTTCPTSTSLIRQGGRARRSCAAQRASAAARTSTSRRRCARRRETFERRDRRPDDGADRRMWPTAISRSDARPATTRAPSAALRVSRPTLEPGLEVRRPVGGDARTRPATPATASRSRSTPQRCVNAKWCHTGCIFGAKNSLITNYLAARRARRRAACGRAARSSRSASRSARPATATSSRLA